VVVMEGNQLFLLKVHGCYGSEGMSQVVVESTLLLWKY
jgi:hypothetical protein